MGTADETIIAVVNDDGPASPGLRALLEEVGRLGKVLAVVPERGEGGRGKSITLFKPIRAMEMGESFYVVSGTPADAFLIALELLRPERPDLLVSGINMGPNIGLEDLFHSGTLGAAIQAVLHGIPAIAISYAIGEGLPRPSEGQMAIDLKTAGQIAVRLASAVLTYGMPEGVDMISVNVPVGADIHRIAITEPLKKPFWSASRAEESFFITPWPKKRPSGPVGSDVWAILNGYVSITPISLSLEHDISSLRSFLERAKML